MTATPRRARSFLGNDEEHANGHREDRPDRQVRFLVAPDRAWWRWRRVNGVG